MSDETRRMEAKGGRPFWFEGKQSGRHHPLAQDMSIDVAIVGGGMVGLHAAHRLRSSGFSVALFEARRIGGQATGRSTAKVTSQHRLKYTSLLETFGEEEARLYARVNEEAVDEIAGIAGSLGALAGASRLPAFVYAEAKDDAERLKKEHETAVRLGLPSELVEDAGLPFLPTLLLKYRDQCQIDPVGYLQGFAEKLSDQVMIYEESRVNEIEHGDPCRLSVNGVTVTARQVVVATQMPVTNDGLFFSKAFPFGHPIAAAPLPDGLAVNGMFITASEPSRSFRVAELDGRQYIIAAGREYKPGEEAQQTDAVTDLLSFLRERFGVHKATHIWTSEDFRPMDGVPFVGPVSSSKPNLLVATGFEAWGLTMGAVAAAIIAGEITDTPHRVREFFAAERLKPLKGGGTFLTENTKAGLHMVGDRLLRRHSVRLAEIAPGEGGIVTKSGEHLAVLREPDGSLRAMSAVCTHMGCVLGWNETDRTFDCPCHGSRFDEHGEVLYGPATAPLEPRHIEQ